MENPDYLTRQLITYIGSKRALLDFIGKGITKVKKKLNKNMSDKAAAIVCYVFASIALAGGIVLFIVRA